MRTIPDELKIYELSRLWKEAEYNFVFWDKLDIDWDEEYKKALSRVLSAKDVYDYYRELKRFTALLCDGHTVVSFPDDLYQDSDCFSRFPVFLFRFGHDIAVIGVSEEYKDEIPLYSVVKKIDGINAEEYIRVNCYPFIWHANEDASGMTAMNVLMFGRNGSSAVFSFEKDGKEFSVKLTREDPNSIKWVSAEAPASSDSQRQLIVSGNTYKCEMTEDGFAIIKLTSFDDNTMPEKIYEYIDELDKAKAYIIDVRGNIGGNSDNADAIASMFIDGDFDSCGAETQIYEPTYKAWGVFRDDLNSLTPAELEERYSDEESIKIYKMRRHIFYKREIEKKENKAPKRLIGPVAVLMNEYTFSAGEDFVDVMKAHTDAVFIGNNTSGSSGQPLQVKLESGGWFRICTRRCFAQNGEDIYNKGFAPDIRIVHSLQDQIEGCDKALDKAILILKEKVGS